MTDEEIRQIAAVRETTFGEILLLHTRLVGGRRSLQEFANGDCTFFDPQTRRCTVYAARPRQCRTWPFWPSHLVSHEEWQRVQSVCPGTRTGPLIPLAEIERQAAEIRI